jgi:pyridoxine 5-phosphate synthase
LSLLGVNIDHVATVRQARRADAPDVIEAARAAVKGGADSITVHLREDRRHIQDADVAALRRVPELRLNLEMAATEEMVRIARVVRPDSVCLVPESRRELTTEGGLDAVGLLKKLKTATEKVKTKGIQVSFFVDPDVAQVEAARAAGADVVEIHTGAYARAAGGTETQHDELKKVQAAAARAKELGLVVNAGHGLDYGNVVPVARIVGVHELNIGFSIVARAVFTGLEQAVREMKKLVS